MNLRDRINAFSVLGEKIENLPDTAFNHLASKVEGENPWFTRDNVCAALKGVVKLLRQEALERWTSSYSLSPTSAKTIGVVMAGNIPLVGFHDLLSVLISGHRLQAKLSQQDYVLPTYVAEVLTAIEPRFADRIFFTKRLRNCDAVIATGSNNTAHYFEYYFSDVPHIIRKNRSSCAVLSGEETEEQLNQLGEDIWLYFGMGCRNVSKVYIPQSYDLTRALRIWEKYGATAQHHQYANNYRYQKAILTTNQQLFFDNGTLLLTPNEELVSPISVVYYERYRNSAEVKNRIERHEKELQCTIAHPSFLPQGIPFGQAQYPEVWQYADNVDTLEFITRIG